MITFSHSFTCRLTSPSLTHTLSRVCPLRRLYSCGDDQTVKMINTQTGQLLDAMDGFSSWSLFVLHWSDSNDQQRIMVLQTVLVMHIFSSLVRTPPRTLGCSHIHASIILERITVSRRCGESNVSAPPMGCCLRVVSIR